MHAAANNVGTILAIVYTALSLTGTGLCVASEATEHGARYPVFRLPKVPDLKDSTYEDAVWENIPWATGFYKLGAFRKVTVQTRFQIGFTEEALHVRVRCEEPDLDRISADSEDDNPGIWREDSVEVFVYPKDTEHVFQVLTNARGAHRNMLNALDLFNATDVSKSTTHAFQGNDEYTVLVTIPFRSLRDTRPADNEIWGFNVLRNRMINGEGAEDRTSTFSKLDRDALEPDHYRELVFHDRAASEEDGKLVYDNSTDDDAGAHQIVNLSFNEGGGDIASAQGAILNHGDMRAAGWSGKGKIGYCAELKKEGDYIQVIHSESLRSIRTELTIDLWAYFDLEKLKGTRATLVTKTPDGGFGFGYMLEYVDTAPKSQALGFYLAESWQKRGHHVLNNAIQTTGWHHILATFNANTMQIVFFIDGLKVLSQDSLIEMIAPSTTALTIGAIERDHEDRTKVSTFRGRLDEVKIWSQALTAEEVQKYYGHMFVKSAPVSPAHLATVADARPVLSWTAAKDGTAAILELSSTPGFIADKTLGGRMSENKYRPDKPLDAGVWYWRIFSTDADGKPTSATKTQAFILADGGKEETFTRADTTPPVITGVRPFAFNTASSDRPTITAKWSDNDSVDLSSARLYLDDEDVTSKALISERGLEFTPAKPLRRGGHGIRIAIRDRAGNNANRVKHVFSTGAKFEARVALRDRRIYVNDEPFFPIIYYHTFANDTDEQMADWGWNVRHINVSSPDWYPEHYKTMDLAEALNRYFDELSGFGQMLFPDYLNYYGADYGSILPIAEMLKIQRDHPRIVSLTMDEPNGRSEGARWAEDFYSTARAVGETRPIIYCLNSPSAASVFARDGIGDGVINSTYPYPSQPGVLAARYADVSREQVNDKKPVWMYGQACDLSSPRGGRYVNTLSETERDELDSGQLVSTVPPGGIRCMMYLSLVHEATGLGWWIHHPGYLGHGGYFPKMKQETIDSVSQVRHLAPMLLAPDAPVELAVAPDDLDLHVKAKEYEGAAYILAVNPHDELPVACRFTLPKGKKFKKVDVLFEDRSFRPSGEEMSFHDLFAPRAVHVYRIEN
jgi:hypothetical protein